MPNNNGPTYTVITDTHGYPWGSKTADFDLGDNTPSTGVGFNEPIHPTVGARHRLFGNHDVAVHGQPKGFEYSSIDIHCT